MSDKFYAVQFRSMHTAIHSIAVFAVKSAAIELLDIINNTEQLPEHFDWNYVNLFEIDFRHPPTHYKEVPLVYINNGLTAIPDVYGY